MNTFNLLCELASNENWCWKFPCSTCGNIDFKYGFLELSKRKIPSDKDWIVHRDSSYQKKLDHYPRNFTEDEKKAVLQICLNANLLIMHEKCHFPFWLGYLGLVLSYFRTDSVIFRKVSVSWSRQLQSIVIKNSQIYKRLGEILKNDSALLHLGDLEHCEKSIIQKNEIF